VCASRHTRATTGTTTGTYASLGATAGSQTSYQLSAYARDNWYDVWLPAVAPSEALLRKTRVLHDKSQWKIFERRYRSELKQPEQSHLLDMLAALSHQTDFSIGCYCADEEQCHRSILRHVLGERGARIERASRKA